MKAITLLFLCLVYGISTSQGTSTTNFIKNQTIVPKNALSQFDSNIGSNGFSFELLDAGINTKYSEIGTDIFRDRLVLVSSKKIGGFAKIDANTGEAYTELFCADIIENGSLTRPLLFSRILNTKDNEDNLAFSPNHQTVYYTRSNKENSLEFKLYKASLQEGTSGIWINHTLVNINKTNVSIETPYVNNAGDKLYFSSNMSEGNGGYDIYVSDINQDGTLGTPMNLGNSINTSHDEKYPAISINNKYLFFSSKGHENLGGYDVFRSRISKNGFISPINLGNTINTSYDEIAYFLTDRNKGYVSSNRAGGKGSFDIYTAINDDVAQVVSGHVIDQETQINLPNTLVILEDIDGDEIARTISNESGVYHFDVTPFENYNLKARKAGHKDTVVSFFTDKGNETTYKINI